MTNGNTTLMHYKGEGMRLINAIERTSGLLMHQLDPKIEDRYWIAADNGNVTDLKKIVFELQRMLQGLEEAE